MWKRRSEDALALVFPHPLLRTLWNPFLICIRAKKRWRRIGCGSFDPHYLWHIAPTHTAIFFFWKNSCWDSCILNWLSWIFPELCHLSSGQWAQRWVRQTNTHSVVTFPCIVCVSVHARSFFFPLKISLFGVFLSLSLSVSRATCQPILTSLWFLERTQAGVKLLGTRLRRYTRVLSGIFFFCSCSGYAHCRTKERSRITKKYVLKDLLTPRAERLLRWQNFQQFNYRVRNIKKKKAVLWFLVRKRLSAKLWKAVNELWTLSPSLGVISVLKRMSV